MTLFGFLCGLEEADRVHGIVRANWGALRRRLGRAEAEPDLEAALGPLVERALVEVVAQGEDPDRRVYRLHPAIVAVGRAEAEAGLQAAVDRELAAFWRAVFEQGRRQQGGEASELVVSSARRAGALCGATPGVECGRIHDRRGHHSGRLPGHVGGPAAHPARHRGGDQGHWG